MRRGFLVPFILAVALVVSGCEMTKGERTGAGAGIGALGGAGLGAAIGSAFGVPGIGALWGGLGGAMIGSLTGAFTGDDAATREEEAARKLSALKPMTFDELTAALGSSGIPEMAQNRILNDARHEQLIAEERGMPVRFYFSSSGTLHSYHPPTNPKS